MEEYVWAWFDGDEEELRALETIFGPQPFVRRVLRPGGQALWRGWARLWSAEDLARAARGEVQVDLERAEALIAWYHGEGELALVRRCREQGLDVRRALTIYRALREGLPRDEAPGG